VHYELIEMDMVALGFEPTVRVALSDLEWAAGPIESVTVFSKPPLRLIRRGEFWRGFGRDRARRGGAGCHGMD